MIVLKKLYERSNLSRKLFLLRKLYSSRDSIIQHLTNICQLNHKLTAIGYGIIYARRLGRHGQQCGHSQETHVGIALWSSQKDTQDTMTSIQQGMYT